MPHCLTSLCQQSFCCHHHCSNIAWMSPSLCPWTPPAPAQMLLELISLLFAPQGVEHGSRLSLSPRLPVVMPRHLPLSADTQSWMKALFALVSCFRRCRFSSWFLTISARTSLDPVSRGLFVAVAGHIVPGTVSGRPLARHSVECYLL